MTSVCFALPLYDGKVLIESSVALASSAAILKAEKSDVAFLWGTESALIDLCRSRLVKRFLEETTCQKLFFIDGDIVFKPKDVFRLLEHAEKYPIVGAVYPRRKDPPRFFLRVHNLELETNEDGLIDVLGLGAGFVVIDRSVFTQMKPYVHTVDTDTETDLEMYFDIRIIGREYLGEDISFYTRWVNECKGKVFIDPFINLKHVGSREFDYKFIDYLNQNTERV